MVLRWFLKGLLVAQLLVVFESFHIVHFADVLVELIRLSGGLILRNHVLKVVSLDNSTYEILVFIRFSN